MVAEIGEEATAICEATTAIDRGREGRILFSLETSMMTGSTE